MTEKKPKRARTRFNRLIDALLPRHCLLCGLASGPHNLCPVCTGELPRVDRPCRHCGLPLPLDSSSPCAECLASKRPWDDAVSALLYAYPADHLVHRFKFSRNLACGGVLGNELLAAVKRNAAGRPDAIVPVPLHRARHVMRSFNQADLLGRQLAGQLGIPVLGRALVRPVRTSAQSGLDATSRRRNLRGAIHCRLDSGSHALPGHIALVDDVMTTGATLAECSRALKRRGVKRISIWVAAVTPAGRGK